MTHPLDPILPPDLDTVPRVSVTLADIAIRLGYVAQACSLGAVLPGCAAQQDLSYHLTWLAKRAVQWLAQLGDPTPVATVRSAYDIGVANRMDDDECWNDRTRLACLTETVGQIAGHVYGDGEPVEADLLAEELARLAAQAASWAAAITDDGEVPVGGDAA